jgi:5-methylcytosine-specific restriction endonuclease McrA
MLPITIENPTKFREVGEKIVAELLPYINEVATTGKYTTRKRVKGKIQVVKIKVTATSRKLFQKINKKSIVEGIVFISPEKLRNHVAWFDRMKFDKKSISDISEIFVDRIYSNLLDKGTLINAIGLNTCPYCNRAYIYTIKKGSINPQLDHFYPKALYPLFAVSLYNLIPSCSTCNSAGAKGSKDTLNKYPIISPYLINHADFHFSHHLLSPAIIKGDYSENAINIHFDKCYNKHNTDVFHLEELYQIHSDHVVDLLYKRKYVFTDDYIKTLTAIVGHKIDQSQINRFIVGAYVEPDNYHKRPLSKLYTEIAKNIGLIEK